MSISVPLTYAAIFLFSGILSFGFFKLALTYYPKFGFLDNPGPYGHKRFPIPLGTGIIIYINFAITALLLVVIGFLEFNEKLAILLFLGFVVSAISFLDDLDTIYKFDGKEKTEPRKSSEELGNVKKTPFAVSPKARLIFQIIIGAIIGLTTIKISYVSGIFGGIVHLDTFALTFAGYEIFLVPLIFTIVWYVLVFNSVNWSDGVPGLTAGLTTITLVVVAILTVRFYLVDETPALRQNSVFVFGIIAIILPSMLIAWYYSINTRMLLGDSGTMFAAFIIASLAILVGGKVATVATALGVYLVDAIYVIFARILNGKNPLKGDRIHHLHFRLQSIGMSDTFIRYFVYILSLFFGISAAFLDRTGKIILFIALIIVIVFITKILSLKK